MVGIKHLNDISRNLLERVEKSSWKYIMQFINILVVLPSNMFNAQHTKLGCHLNNKHGNWISAVTVPAFFVSYTKSRRKFFTFYKLITEATAGSQVFLGKISVSEKTELHWIQSMLTATIINNGAVSVHCKKGDRSLDFLYEDKLLLQESIATFLRSINKEYSHGPVETKTCTWDSA